MIAYTVSTKQYEIANIYWGFPNIMTAAMVQEALDWYYEGSYDD